MSEKLSVAEEKARLLEFNRDINRNLRYWENFKKEFTRLQSSAIAKISEAEKAYADLLTSHATVDNKIEALLIRRKSIRKSLQQLRHRPKLDRLAQLKAEIAKIEADFPGGIVPPPA